MGWNPMNLLKAPKIRSSSLPEEYIDEKARAAARRHYEGRPLPTVPPPTPFYPVIPEQAYPHHPASHAPKRQRTVSHGVPQRGILKPSKEYTVAPPMQASGKLALVTVIKRLDEAGPKPPCNPEAGLTMSAMQGITHQRETGSLTQMFTVTTAMAFRYNGGAPLTRAQTDMVITHRVLSSSYESQDDPPVAVTQIRASNYVSAYIKAVPMKPENIALCWPLRTPPKDGRKPHHPEATWLTYFDIAFDPRDDSGRNVRIIEGWAHNRPIRVVELDSPASTHCTLKEMYIVLPEHPEWPVVVRRAEGIRCRDVLQAIYDTFHIRLTQLELNNMPPEKINGAWPHFDIRCKQASGLPAYNREQGLLRVDVLRSHKIFAGLEQDAKVDKRWVLRLNSYYNQQQRPLR
ncbi:hypothetical protein AX17_006683 [Amanita inopinata Kibby_2008]|nr:hypothetical protein AX17_006683 [Amanita inopinata Kibby_2008]